MMYVVLHAPKKAPASGPPAQRLNIDPYRAVTNVAGCAHPPCCAHHSTWAAWPMLAAAFTLYYLRDRDTLLTVE